MGWVGAWLADWRGEMFAAVTDVPALTRAWMKVRANRGGPGGDGMTIDIFAREVNGRLAALARHLRDGTYRPGPLRRLDIAKAHGGVRTLTIPCVADRIVQASVATALAERLDPDFSDDSFAYRRGRSVLQATSRLRHLRTEGYVWTVDGDIHRFFDSIPGRVVTAALAKPVADRRLRALVATWLAHWGGQGLPQGSPLSPVLANLVLHPLDQAARRVNGGAWIRYADDFVLACRSQRTAAAGLRTIARHLAGLGLELNGTKTTLIPPWQPIDFLGETFPAVRPA